MIGKKFGSLTVIAKGDSHFTGSSMRTTWVCQCDCGGQIVKQQHILRRSTNHGCLECETERRSLGHTKHGGTKGGKSRLFVIWKSMRYRCSNPKNKHYGGKGISLCAEWKNDFGVFRDWAMANGYKDNLTIDRLNPNKNYQPDNCEWVTSAENSRRISSPAFLFKQNQEDFILGQLGMVA